MHLHHLRLSVILMIFLGSLGSSLSPAQEILAAGSRKVVSEGKIEYPRLAQKNSLGGTVKIMVVVSPDGRVARCEVIGGNPVFVSAVVESVRRWKWQPTTTETKEPIEITFQPN